MKEKNDKTKLETDKKPEEESLATASYSAVHVYEDYEGNYHLTTQDGRVMLTDTYAYDSSPEERLERMEYLAKKLSSKVYPVQSESVQGTIQEEYNELIMAVESKFQGESRHETALRYITERESGSLLVTQERTGCDHDCEIKQDSSGEVDGGPGDQWEWRECRICGETEEPSNEYDSMVGEQKERYNP